MGWSLLRYLKYEKVLGFIGARVASFCKIQIKGFIHLQLWGTFICSKVFLCKMMQSQMVQKNSINSTPTLDG